MNSSERALEGKRVIVTGGSRGIGNEIVRQCLSSGADVYYMSRSEAADHADLSELAASNGRQVTWIAADMADEQSVSSAVKQVLDTAGGVDVLVNNAGITRDGLIMRMKTEDWEDVLKVNLTGAFIACRAVTRAMAKARGGAIINISSVVGITGNAGQTNYSAAKAGLIGFSKSLARELASRTVRVNVVAPGFINTDMTSVLSDEIRASISGSIPLGRIGEAKEIAEVVTFLASDRASYITGQVLAVDGGMTM
ncbi:MAG: 3-oxoacyl-[acyl-carrier-protein] reductase [Spirochaetia bacterium]|nr:3-oxoacyl-[acyl-carrier-protein] reductase [Spirochaetia bacterium]